MYGSAFSVSALVRSLRGGLGMHSCQLRVLFGSMLREVYIQCFHDCAVCDVFVSGKHKGYFGSCHLVP